jgi:hypothetical protein
MQPQRLMWIHLDGSLSFLPTIAGVLATACLKSKPSNNGVPNRRRVGDQTLACK